MAVVDYLQVINSIPKVIDWTLNSSIILISSAGASSPVVATNAGSTDWFVHSYFLECMRYIFLSSAVLVEFYFLYHC